LVRRTCESSLAIKSRVVNPPTAGLVTLTLRPVSRVKRPATIAGQPRVVLDAPVPAV